MIKLYELVDNSGKPYSPFCWRTRLCLAHKGIDFEVVQIQLAETNSVILNLTNQKWSKVPAVDFDGEVVYESTEIAYYLDKKYTKAPLFPNGRQYSTFCNAQSKSVYGMFQLILPEVISHQNTEGKKFYTKRFASTEEEIKKKALSLDSTSAINDFASPYAEVLSKSNFLEGDSPTYTDYILFGYLYMLKLRGADYYEKHIKNDDKNKCLDMWFNRVLELHNGYAKKHIG